MVLWITKGITPKDMLKGSLDKFDRTVAKEMFACIVPGYLILPYLATPLVEHVLPYWIGKWMVRSKRISLRDAEKCLECPEFDCVWEYSDMINNFTICLLMLFMVS